MCTEISGYRLLRDLNKTKLVLSTFNDNLFALNQVESKSNSLLTVCSFDFVIYFVLLLLFFVSYWDSIPHVTDACAPATSCIELFLLCHRSTATGNLRLRSLTTQIISDNDKPAYEVTLLLSLSSPRLSKRRRYCYARRLCVCPPSRDCTSH